ncbi:ATP-grasp domain-containing protein [Streptomyces sp. NPDC048479]|uniref:ATP-grasp domain-containing protein n=1 Tax=Streptomyces sp. NPDC048479 TaxID=3154725 RepID=UPI003448B043
MHVAALEWLTFGLARAVTAAVERGLTLHLLTSDRTEYAFGLRRSAPGSLVIHDVDTSDPTCVAKELRAIDGLAGLISTTDVCSLVSLEVAAELGLAAQPSDAVRLVRDKGALRRYLYMMGLSRASQVTVDPFAADVLAATGMLTYPAVLKDASGTGSEGVWIAQGPDDVPGILDAARTGRLRGGVLTAEPYFSGPLYSAETLSWDGETRLLGISSRLLSPLPHFREEGEAFPVAFPEPQAAELAGWISSVLNGIAYRGFSHTEFIITDDGYEIVEINPRLGGGMIGELICDAYETNIYEAFFDMALGRRPALLDAPLVAVRGMAEVDLMADRTGVFDGFDGEDRLAGHPGSPRLCSARSHGETVDSLTDWRGSLGSIVAEGPTAELAMHNAAAAARLVRPRVI